MITLGKYSCIFFSWLRHIVRTVAFRSYRSLLSVLLRLVRHCQSIVNGKEEDFREWPGGLALNSQPRTNQPESAPPMSLAVPLLEAPLQSLHGQESQSQSTPRLHGQSANDAAFNADSPPNSSVPSRPSSLSQSSIPEPCITISLPFAMLGQTFDITLIPITPGEINRDSRNVRHDTDLGDFLVKQGPLDYSEELTPVAGWEPLTQPKGTLIFYQPHRRVFTDADVQDPETRVKIDKAIEKAYQEARNANIPLDPFVELGLELTEYFGEEVWGYYFADHTRRIIFWFEDYTSSNLTGYVRGVKRKSHVKYALESQYWRHIELFPNKRVLPKDIVVRLKEIVVHAHVENITYASLAPFTPNEVANILGLMDLLKDNCNKEHEHSVLIVARFMRLFCNANFINFHGQPGARLEVNQSLYGESDGSSKNMFFRVMNVILFGSPDAQRKNLQSVYVDETIVWSLWKDFTDNLNSLWSGYTIFSTVTLAVDISLLAVPSVQTQALSVLLLYLSAICAMGSLTVTIFLVEQFHDGLRGPRTDTMSFMHDISQSRLGKEGVALMLSLPFAFLIWGMAFFTAAMSVTISFTDSAVIWIAYPVWLAIVILAMWPMIATGRVRVVSILWNLLRVWCRIIVSRVCS